jgi:hypothetical protein
VVQDNRNGIEASGRATPGVGEDYMRKWGGDDGTERTDVSPGLTTSLRTPWAGYFLFLNLWVLVWKMKEIILSLRVLLGVHELMLGRRISIVSGTCFVSLLGLAFELRALCLQSRRSTS